MDSNGLGRRYLKTREKAWVQKIALKISKSNITPNQISILSVVSALLASITLVYHESNLKWLLAVTFIQFRLCCNMFDGLVAIEGGKKSKLGDVYNDLPDRIADILIIIAFGYSVAINNMIVNLAWLAVVLAIFTSYIRTLFTSLGATADYCGPMAKQHRMAFLSVACVLCYFIWLDNPGIIVFYSLIILNIGSLITIYKRIKHGVNYLLCH